MIKVGMISLGCAKNLVDSEMVLGMFAKSKFEIVNDPKIADVIIVNTCGFINSAKEEAINTIFEMAQFKKRLVVIGCLVERYQDELRKLIGEVDLFVAISDYQKLPELINGLFNKPVLSCGLNYENRVLSTPFFTAYLKISEGCDNCCTYCAIPLIRGGFKSRELEELVLEAKIIAKKGVKELVVISQDTTRYGSDFNQNITIVTLLKELLKIEEFNYIRLLYLYPDEVSDELLNLIAKEKKLTPYFDLPIQHASDNILMNMNRRGNQEFLRSLIEKIRAKVPNSIIRTTLIVGFPDETDSDFLELCNFVEEMQFDHLGVFMYSKEEGTKAYTFKKQVSEVIKKKRFEKIMEIQRKIVFKKNKNYIGEIMEGMVVKSNAKSHNYELRNGFNAPDEIDGKIIFTSEIPLKLGDMVRVKITHVLSYDLYGEYINLIN